MSHITLLQAVNFIVLGYVIMCCIALWQYKIRHYFTFPSLTRYLVVLHTILSVGVLVGAV